MFDETTFHTTLKKINELLKAEKINWCLGASGSLYVQGVEVEPNDIDIVIKKGEMDQAVFALRSLKPSPIEIGVFNNTEYKNTKLNRTLMPAECSEFELNPKRIGVTWKGLYVPVNQLEFELQMYKTRPGKEVTVRLIEDKLNQ